MKRIAFLCLLSGLLLFINCSPESTNVQNSESAAVQNTSNANAADSAANASTPTAGNSSVGNENFSNANFPQISREIHQRVNEFRQSQGLEPLALNPVISEQARQHSVDMSKTPDTISHEDFQKRVEQLRGQLPFQAVAENVAANLNYDNPGVQAVEGWKKSPTHRKNMLGDFNQTGIGIAQSENGNYFFTQIFWKP